MSFLQGCFSFGATGVETLHHLPCMESKRDTVATSDLDLVQTSL